MRITDIDKNFIQNAVEEDVSWIKLRNGPFTIHGVFYDMDEQQFLRLPINLAEQLNERIVALNKYTAGGRVRFKTTADFIGLRYITTSDGFMPHMPLTGSHGFSVYENNIFCGKVAPVADAIKSKGDIACEGKIWFQTQGLKSVELYFPLYACVKELYLGFPENGEIYPADEYENKLILYYGSSITQGGCASRPGNDYQAYIERWNNSDYINLGFAGNAKGELEIAKHIVKLAPEVIIVDYDHNAPDAEYLGKTHYPFYKTIRDGLPDSYIVLMSKPDFSRKRIDDVNRRRVIKNTYMQAKYEGDEKVLFVDGKSLFGKEDKDSCTIDRTHPNDLGFYRIAKKLYSRIKNISKME